MVPLRTKLKKNGDIVEVLDNAATKPSRPAELRGADGPANKIGTWIQEGKKRRARGAWRKVFEY